MLRGVAVLYPFFHSEGIPTDAMTASQPGASPALAEKADLQATLDKQLETIKELTRKASDTQKVEQRNRELHNRADNLQGEIAELKQRLKALQKDLNAVREE